MTTPTPAVRIHQDRGGNWTAHAVTLNYSRPAALGEACEQVRAGRTVFVAAEDADAVLSAARGEGAESGADGVQ